jgi:DNA-directed RNA polymerase specialized sigma24 family protein
MIEVNTHELEIADKVANRIGSRWSEVENEDLNSFLYLWLVEHNEAVKRWRDEPMGNGKLYVALRREAAKYCAAEQAARIGRPINAGNFYTSTLIANAMPYVFEETPQTDTVVDPRTGVSQKNGYEFDRAITIMADIRGAYYGLNKDIQQTLAYRFRDGLTYEEIGELRGLTKDGALKQVQRALERLSNALGGTAL